MPELKSLLVAEHGADKHTNITRNVFLPAVTGYVTAGSLASRLGFDCISGGANADEPSVVITTIVPPDFVSLVSVKALWDAASGGNMYWRLSAAFLHNYDPDAPMFYRVLDTTALGVTNIIIGGSGRLQEPADPLTLPNLVAGDILTTLSIY
jgi:hypothetical protein